MVAVCLAWICVTRFGLNGAGIAFLGSYIFHGLLTYPIVSRLSGFRWSSVNKRTGLLSLSLIAAVFGGFYAMPFLYAVALGILALVVSSAYSIRVLLKYVSLHQVPRPLRRLLIAMGFASADAQTVT